MQIKRVMITYENGVNTWVSFDEFFKQILDKELPMQVLDPTFQENIGLLKDIVNPEKKHWAWKLYKKWQRKLLKESQ